MRFYKTTSAAMDLSDHNVGPNQGAPHMGVPDPIRPPTEFEKPREPYAQPYSARQTVRLSWRMVGSCVLPDRIFWFWEGEEA